MYDVYHTFLNGKKSSVLFSFLDIIIIIIIIIINNNNNSNCKEKGRFFPATIVCSPGIMVKAMDCGFVVSGFELQLHYYVHFRINTLWKYKG